MDFLDSHTWTALFLSLKVAFWATGLNIVMALFLAWLFARYSFIGKETFDAILTLPMVMPPTVLGYYLLVLFGQKGVLGSWLKDYLGVSLVFSWQGAVLAAMVMTFPLIFKPARGAFESLNPKYAQVAQTLGLADSRIFFRVILPLAWRHILVGILLGFARSLGEFGATLMIAGNIPGRTQTLSLAVYQAVQNGEDDLAWQLTLLIAIVCILILACMTYLAPAKEKRA